MKDQNFPLTRRAAVKLVAAASAAVAFGAISGAAAPPPRPAGSAGLPKEIPPLPYAYDALEPHIDGETMRIHHDKHHAS